jgi:hypothetical protein
MGFPAAVSIVLASAHDWRSRPCHEAGQPCIQIEGRHRGAPPTALLGQSLVMDELMQTGDLILDSRVRTSSCRGHQRR